MRELVIKSVLGLAAAGSLAVASPAFAAQFVFPMTGSSATSGTHGNSRTFTATSGSETLTVRATGWSLTSANSAGVVYDSFLGAFSNGLGVTSGDEDGSSNTHVTDNQNRFDFIVFQFDRPVVLESARFTTYTFNGVRDGDATIGFGNTALPYTSQPALDGQGFASLQSLFGGGFSTSLGGGGTRLLNSGGNVGNIWLVGAAFNNADGKIDGFKLSNVTVSSPVPEPATWMMMIAGFGLVGAMMRRRRSIAAAALQGA